MEDDAVIFVRPELAEVLHSLEAYEGGPFLIGSGEVVDNLFFESEFEDVVILQERYLGEVVEVASYRYGVVLFVELEVDLVLFGHLVQHLTN